jgi:hypothetical protein
MSSLWVMPGEDARKILESLAFFTDFECTGPACLNFYYCIQASENGS